MKNNKGKVILIRSVGVAGEGGEGEGGCVFNINLYWQTC